jgi:hypothetical protein
LSDRHERMKVAGTTGKGDQSTHPTTLLPDRIDCPHAPAPTSSAA